MDQDGFRRILGVAKGHEEAKAADVVAKLRAMKLKTAADPVEGEIHETLTFYAYPSQRSGETHPARTNKAADRRATSV